MAGEQFSLVWNSFPTNLSSGLYALLTDEHLVDVTLTAEGRILRAHKLILSVCSSYFRELFKGNTCKHPIVILKDANYRDLAAMLHFMYQGEVNIKQEDISSFLKLAETLEIKGLTKEDKRNTRNRETEKKNDASAKTETQPNEVSIERETGESALPRFIEPPGSPQRNISFSVRKEENAFMKISSSETLDHCETDSETENATGSTNGAFDDNYKNDENYKNNENKLSAMEDEPLDYTSDYTTLRDNSEDAKEPLNFRLGTTDPSQDYVPNCQQISYSQDYQKETLGVNDANLTSSRESRIFADGPSYARGKRTVRGIAGGSLPLETTLRVVSELGPTLRLERGKVVRMYSCPWCLRHFTRKENLKLHVRYIHGPLESLTCNLCGNKYKNSNSLRVHSYLYHNTKRNKHAKPLVGGAI